MSSGSAKAGDKEEKEVAGMQYLVNGSVIAEAVVEKTENVVGTGQVDASMVGDEDVVEDSDDDDDTRNSAEHEQDEYLGCLEDAPVLDSVIKPELRLQLHK
jgi:hypothetical protein